jgi:hypothetical protein
VKKLLLIALLMPATSFLLRSDRVQKWLTTRWTLLRNSVLSLGVLLVLLTIAGGFLAASTERIIFHDEATVLSTAAAFYHGQSMYPSATDPVEYALLYGPATYLVYLPPMFAGAVRTVDYQAWAALALAGAFIFLYFALRELGSSASLGGLVLFAVFVCEFTYNEWAIKGDVWILLFSALGLWASLSLNGWKASAVIAVSGAMLVDLKITLVLISLLPCILLWQRDRKTRVAALIAAVFVPVLAALPFALPRISILAYTQQLQSAAHHGISSSLLLVNLELFLVMLLPTVGLLWISSDGNKSVIRLWKRRQIYLLTFGVAAVVALVTGAKNGAGPWHCMPLLIPLIFIDAEIGCTAAQTTKASLLQSARRAPLLPATAAVLLLTAFSSLAQGVKARLHDPDLYRPVSPRAVERDIISVIKEHSGSKLQMGYSDLAHYNFTFPRSVLQLYGSPLFIDADARDEADLIHKPVSPEVINALRTCSIDLWLIPKEGSPFSLESLYFVDGTISQRALYPEAFRQAFFDSYQRVPSKSQYFDIWECRAHMTSSKPIPNQDVHPQRRLTSGLTRP